jgi:hypothetical protein
MSNLDPIASTSHKQAVQLRLLNELSTKLQSLIDSAAFYPEIINIIQSKFNYYCLHVFSVNPTGQSVTLQAQAGAYRDHLIIGQTIPLSRGIIGVVYRSRKSYLCNGTQRSGDEERRRGRHGQCRERSARCL